MKNLFNTTCRPRVRYQKRHVAFLALAALFVSLAAPKSWALTELTSYALVRDDATLEVSGRHIRLAGIYLPDSGRVCETRVRPVRCGTRAAQALRFKNRGFVNCSLTGRYSDGSYAGYCRIDDLDLGTYLIDRGWAVATPDAPFQYHVHERIARHRGFGVWGFHADSIVTDP